MLAQRKIAYDESQKNYKQMKTKKLVKVEQAKNVNVNKEIYINLKIIENFKKLLLLLWNCAKIQLLVKHICGTYIRDKEGFSHERSVVGQNKKNQQAIA